MFEQLNTASRSGAHLQGPSAINTEEPGPSFPFHSNSNQKVSPILPNPATPSGSDAPLGKTVPPFSSSGFIHVLGPDVMTLQGSRQWGIQISISCHGAAGLGWFEWRQPTFPPVSRVSSVPLGCYIMGLIH